jgi:putative hemolysin
MTANPRIIETKVASTEQELRAAERLRYDVFVRELGGTGENVDHVLGLERDMFDPHADHLIAIDRAADDAVVGVYRVLTREMADKAGRFYSEDEYDLSALKSSGRRLLELGRSCVHADYRGGTTMFQLWQGLADYVACHEIEVLFGVASFHGTDPQKYAHALSNLAVNFLADETLRPVSNLYQPMSIIAPDQIDRAAAIKDTPPLIKSYLRLGGVVGDGAFIDHEFNTIDVCLIMDTEKMSSKHRSIYGKANAR